MIRRTMEYGRAICYSGFREGQCPQRGVFPTERQIREDLQMLDGHWDLIRMYDCDQMAKTTLKLIREEGFNIKVLLGTHLDAEVSNPGCPWGAFYPDKVLHKNRMDNQRRVQELIDCANEYSDIVVATSAGNEATVDWTDHLVPVDRVIELVKKIRSHTPQPVTFCENYVPWHNKLEGLVEEVDFISIHTYPVWEYKGMDEALQYTKENYYGVAHRYPDVPVVITEAGWTTNSNGSGINPEMANEENQHAYYEQLLDWVQEEKILTFIFEAFDEPWKGSEDPMEPEKHWGLYTVDRMPKKVLQT